MGKVFSILKLLFAVILPLIPWRLRRLIYIKCYGWVIHEKARIGLCLILCEKIVMGEGAKIGNGNVIKGLRLVSMDDFSSIGRLNWITGFPANRVDFFSSQSERNPELLIGRHAAVTNRHLIDCTDRVEVGEFATFAGFRSQILTHSIDIGRGVQAAKPIKMGAYSFVGTGCILLPGCMLPERSVLAAGSVLNREFVEPYQLYAGIPAKPVKLLSQESKYFTRSVGVVR